MILLVNFVSIGIEQLTEIMTALTGFYLMVLILWRPYVMKLQNLGIIFNQGNVVIFLVLQVLSKYKVLDATVKMVSLYLTIGLISVALVLQIVRVFAHANSQGQVYKK